MKYFKAWVSENHPQLIEDYSDSHITLWEQCCRYHKEVIKEYRLDVDAIKTIEHERDLLRRALEKAAGLFLSDNQCPYRVASWEFESGCENICGREPEQAKDCWMQYFMEEE